MVLLDVVYNHFGPEGNYLHAVCAAVLHRAPHDAVGRGDQFRRPGSRTVRDFFIHNALYWLEEFHFDGLRLDAVHAIVDDSPSRHRGRARRRRARAAPGGRHVHLVLENDRNEARYLARGRRRPRALADAQWNDDFHHALHVLLTGETRRLLRRLRRRAAAAASAAASRRASRTRASPRAYRDGAAPRRVRARGLPPSAFVIFTAERTIRSATARSASARPRWRERRCAEAGARDPAARAGGPDALHGRGVGRDLARSCSSATSGLSSPRPSRGAGTRNSGASRVSATPRCWRRSRTRTTSSRSARARSTVDASRGDAACGLARVHRGPAGKARCARRSASGRHGTRWPVAGGRPVAAGGLGAGRRRVSPPPRELRATERRHPARRRAAASAARGRCSRHRPDGNARRGRHAGNTRMTDALRRLAEAHGIVGEYDDIWGRRHVISDATRRALLAAMGVAAEHEDAIEAAAAGVRARALGRADRWPLSVVRQGRQGALTIRVPDAFAGRRHAHRRRDRGRRSCDAVRPRHSCQGTRG